MSEKLRPILETRGLGISFGGLKAVQDFNLRLYPGELAGLIGPNGAGKTTVFNLLTGVYVPTEGSVMLDSEVLNGKKTHQFVAAGVARTFQNIRLFRQMSVIDNVKAAFAKDIKYRMGAALFRTPGYWRAEAAMEQKALELREHEHIFILCGHYEGVDQRVLDEIVDEEISLGDYVLTGGELGALVVADAVGRLCPGVLSEEVCFTEESHYSGLLEYPQYTRPPVWHGMQVPAVLSSGHHANIQKWQREQSLRVTAQKRPDLLHKAIGEGRLTKKELEWVQPLLDEEEPF